MVTNNLPVDEVWREQANCKDVPLDNFFPLEITKQNRKEINLIYKKTLKGRQPALRGLMN